MHRVLFIVIFSILATNMAKAATFSGTLQLPQGVTAGASGAQFEVRTFFVEFFQDDNGFFQTSSDDAVIPPFGSSANFSFELPDIPSQSTHNITFNCETGCESLDATTTGYWNASSGVVGSPFDATDYVSTVNQTINIQLEAADRFIGTVLFPPGLTAAGDEQIVIRVRESAEFTLDSYIQYWYPEAGETNSGFVIGAPTSAATSAWEIEFYCNNCDDDIIDADLFPTTVLGDPASVNEADQFIFLKASDYSNMTMTLLAVPTNSGDSNINGAIYILLDEE